MEGDLRTSPKLAYSVDNNTEIDASKVSALLVATIQEAKDRMSEVEHMFCCQLFPDYQSKSVNLHNVYSQAKKAAEDALKEREKDLSLQIEKLQFEKQKALDENQVLKLEKAEFEKFVRPSSKFINDLQEELKQKTAEVADGRKLHQSLLRLLESKDVVILNNEKTIKEVEEKINLVLQGRSLEFETNDLREELKKSKQVDGEVELHKDIQPKEHEEKTTELLAKIESVEEKVDELEGELRLKTKQIDKGKEIHEYLQNKIESEMVNNEKLLKDYEKEKRLLTAKIESLEHNVKEFQEELRKKTEEVEEGRRMQEQLRQQIDLNGLEMLKTGQELEELQKEKSLHLAKLKVLEEKVDKLQLNLRERSIESAERMELHGKLLQQIEAKDFELSSEKKKRRNVIDSYKRLKSQYNFLCTRNGLTPENMLPQNKTEDERHSVRHNQSPLTSPGTGDKVVNASVVNCELNRQHDNQENLINNQGVGLIQRSRSELPCTSSSPVTAQGHVNVKSGPLAGTKRTVSHWRETRSHQNRGGPDPHDDFFDTPLENIRGNLKKAMKEVHDFPDPVPKDMTFHSSDDETQDINVDPDPVPEKQEMPPPKPGMIGFKYVEPVRKKAERENLKGIECMQCKKFYDAVLPDGGGKDTDGNKQNLRCEHHDGVSRHRYRYAPPSTPEGFWNIGFESEM